MICRIFPLFVRSLPDASCRRVARLVLAFVFAGGVVMAVPPDSSPDLAPLKRWIAAQKGVGSLRAEFTQTRALRTLRSPLTTTGRLWFQAPGWFRWELGNPPKTLVLGTPDGVTVIHPGNKRAERRPRSAQGEAGFDGFGVFPGAASLEEFQRRVLVLGVEVVGSVCRVAMLPRDAQVARRLSAVKLEFDTETGHWLSLEIVTRDGASIRNDFRAVEINPKLEKGVFDFDFEGYRVSDEKN